jgi:hypothetical protein
MFNTECGLRRYESYIRPRFCSVLPIVCRILGECMKMKTIDGTEIRIYDKAFITYVDLATRVGSGKYFHNGRHGISVILGAYKTPYSESWFIAKWMQDGTYIHSHDSVVHWDKLHPMTLVLE